jgi:hypothetical protein
MIPVLKKQKPTLPEAKWGKIWVVSATPRNVKGNVLSELSNDVLVHMHKQSSRARNLLNHRKDGHLPNPTTINFYIPEKYSQLVRHRQVV